MFSSIENSFQKTSKCYPVISKLQMEIMKLEKKALLTIQDLLESGDSDRGTHILFDSND